MTEGPRHPVAEVPSPLEIREVPWTVERANRALPLVRRIADDLVHQYGEWRDLVAQFELATTRSSPAQPDHEAERLQRATLRAAEEIEGFVRELAELGIECKSLETGLIDFPAERDGRPVLLCWQRGEPTVAHWHERDAGFAGRQPLP